MPSFLILKNKNLDFELAQHTKMPSTHHQKCNARSSRSSSLEKAPHFFKIIHSATVEKQKLRIPPKFVSKYGKNLSTPIFLKVPSGAEWQVELTKCNGEVWLEKGWQDFADYYSIVLGHFLVFKYNGNSCFHVLIFDKSASEIEYPINSSRNPKMEESEDDVSVEIINGFPPKRKEKTSLQCGQPCEIAKKDNSCQQLALHSQSNGIATKRVKLETKEFSGVKVLNKRQAVSSATDKVGALERANAYKSENPRFIVTMQPSYVSLYFRLNLPLAFVRKYFTKKHYNVSLQVADKNTWSAMYQLGSTNSKLYGGWRKFTEDNHLRVGDVCVFELIKEVDNSLKVVIFRDTEGAT